MNLEIETMKLEFQSLKASDLFFVLHKEDLKVDLIHIRNVIQGQTKVIDMNSRIQFIEV